MANVAFDKHVEFCEKYMNGVNETISTLFIKGPSDDVKSNLEKLINIKSEYSAWITQDIAVQLEPFEKAIRKIVVLSEEELSLRKSDKPEDQEARKKAIKETYRIFRKVMNLKNDPKEVENSEIAVEIVKRKVRSILGIEELTKLRKMLVNKALRSIEDMP